jgi:PST family polysaccharide transporter
VIAYIAATILRSAGVIYFTGLEPWARPTGASFRDILPFASGQTIAQAANHIATESDNIIVGSTFGAAALGSYGRAYSIAVAPANSLSAAVDKVFYPNLVQLRHANAPLGPSYLATTKLAVALVLPAAALTVVAAPEIVLTLLGSNWSQVVLPLRILSVGLIFRALFQMSDCYCRAAGAVYGSGARQSAYAACVIVGSLIGSMWGPPGVAAGVVLAMMAKYVLMTQLSLERLSVSSAAYVAAIADGAQIGSIVTALVLATIQFCRHAQSPAVVTCLAAGIVLCVTAVFKLRSITNHTFAIG